MEACKKGRVVERQDTHVQDDPGPRTKESTSPKWRLP